jgi:hypothetical protein
MSMIERRGITLAGVLGNLTDGDPIQLGLPVDGERTSALPLLPG